MLRRTFKAELGGTTTKAKELVERAFGSVATSSKGVLLSPSLSKRGKREEKNREKGARDSVNGAAANSNNENAEEEGEEKMGQEERHVDSSVFLTDDTIDGLLFAVLEESRPPRREEKQKKSLAPSEKSESAVVV